MATKEQIKKAILDVAGNPSSGVIADLADKWAEAIYKLDDEASASWRSEKETRVTKPAELR